MVVNRRGIEDKMKELGLNQGELAQLVGMSRTTFNSLLNGKRKPSYDTMNLVYYVLSLNPEETVDIFFNNKVMMPKHQIECCRQIFLRSQNLLLLDFSQEEYFQLLIDKAFY